MSGPNAQLELRGPWASAAQALLILTALTTLIAAPLAAVNAQWFMVGFEVVALAAAVIGFLAARGRPAYGQPLALVCVAGAIAAASFLESIGIDRAFLGPFGKRLATVQAPGVTIRLDALLLLRLLIAALLTLFAGAMLNRRSPRDATRRLVIGLAFSAAGLGALAAAWLGRAAIAAAPGPVKWAILVFGFIAVTGLLAAAAQHLIDAFSAKPRRATENS